MTTRVKQKLLELFKSWGGGISSAEILMTHVEPIVDKAIAKAENNVRKALNKKERE